MEAETNYGTCAKCGSRIRNEVCSTPELHSAFQVDASFRPHPNIAPDWSELAPPTPHDAHKKSVKR